MGWIPLLLVLASALLHATWNLIVKSSDDRLLAAWSQVAFGAAITAPALIALGVPTSALPSIVASALVHTLYSLLLVTAYRHGDLSMVYPIARGSAPVLVTVVAWILLDDRISAMGLVAIALVVAGVLSVGTTRRTRGVGWALATGVMIATYTTIDGAAVRTLDSAISYTLSVFVLTAALLTLVVGRQRTLGQIRTVLRSEGRRHLLAGAGSAGAYLLVLTAARLAPLGLVAAFRETSVLFGTLGGWLILHEPDARRRLRGAALISVGLAVLILLA